MIFFLIPVKFPKKGRILEAKNRKNHKSKIVFEVNSILKIPNKCKSSCARPPASPSRNSPVHAIGHYLRTLLADIRKWSFFKILFGLKTTLEVILFGFCTSKNLQLPLIFYSRWVLENIKHLSLYWWQKEREERNKTMKTTRDFYDNFFFANIGVRIKRKWWSVLNTSLVCPACLKLPCLNIGMAKFCMPDNDKTFVTIKRFKYFSNSWLIIFVTEEIIWIYKNVITCPWFCSSINLCCRYHIYHIDFRKKRLNYTMQ